MRNRRFDVVFVDFFGTLAAGDRAAVELACQGIVAALELPMPATEFAITWGETFFALVDGSNHDQFRTLRECEKRSLTATIQQVTGRELSEREVEAFVTPIEDYWADPPLHADAIPFLRGLDLPVCCVSNADEKPLQSAINKLELRFDAVVTSEAARSYKPDKVIFEHACRRMGVEPSRAIHIGDSLHSDIQGAHDAGIEAIWLCRDDRIHDIGTCDANHTISRLIEALPFFAHGRSPQ